MQIVRQKSYDENILANDHFRHRQIRDHARVAEMGAFRTFAAIPDDDRVQDAALRLEMGKMGTWLLMEQKAYSVSSKMEFTVALGSLLKPASIFREKENQHVSRGRSR